MSTSPSSALPLEAATQRFSLLNRMTISRKLTIAFGVLVLLTLGVIGISYWGSAGATEKINRTNEERVPAALASDRAQANLLQMVGDVRGYLALGDNNLRTSYERTRQAFEANLHELEQLPGLDQQKLQELRTAYQAWQPLPNTLFNLHDDQLQREPALRMLIKDANPLIVPISQNTRRLIDGRAQGTLDAGQVALLRDLALFQSSFSSMISGLRGWVTTKRTSFYTEYISNSIINEESWKRLTSQHDQFTTDQRAQLDQIGVNRDKLLPLADEIISLAAGTRSREDLYQFQTQAEPLAQKMIDALGAISSDQQTRLAEDLSAGNFDLFRARGQMLAGGGIALVAAVIMSYIFRAHISGPIRRLTAVAELIRTGNLSARATVESSDEIGTLATTFNNMTGQLQHTLVQVRSEKKRADDLLEVVIPIGVAFSSEKDFNRLLERIVLEAKEFCSASAGMLFLRDGERLRHVIVRDDHAPPPIEGTTSTPLPQRFADDESVAARVAQTGESINLADVAHANGYQIEIAADYDATLGTPTLLAIPLKNSNHEVVGVLQLRDAQDKATNTVIAFDHNLQQMMESLSLLAAAALEAYIREQGLRQEIMQLRIEIDEAKRQKAVSDIVDSDFFQDIQNRARSMRARNRGGSANTDPQPAPTPAAPDPEAVQHDQ